MSKAFTKESDGDDEDDLPDEIAGLPAGAKTVSYTHLTLPTKA